MTTMASDGNGLPDAPPQTGEAICPACGGTGKVERGPCPTCGGTGKVLEPVGDA